MPATLTKEEILEQIRQLEAAGFRPPSQAIAAAKVAKLNVIDYGQKYYYIPETSQPIIWEPWQRILLKIITGIHDYPTLLDFYSTILITTIKKTGKTAITGVIGRWRAEQSVPMDEILFFANDEQQSRGRAYAGIEKSITLDPHYDQKKRMLYDEHGNEVWQVIQDHLLHVPTKTKIKAVNVDYRGEAGANPSLTIWTEAWGFDTEKQLMLYQEMTPVLTRYHSQRIVESYAGYTGKSILLEEIWKSAEKDGRRLTIDEIPDWPWPDEHELPFYVNDNAGLFAFIDQGPVARSRMPWTNEHHPVYGPAATRYYIEQANQPGMTPEQMDRLHNNYWVSPSAAFIPLQWWEACEDTSIPPLLPANEPTQILTIPDLDSVLPDGRRAIDAYMHKSNWRVVRASEPMVLSIDASVTGDCTGLTGMTRHPLAYDKAALRLAVKWVPPKNGKLDYEFTPSTTTGLSLRQQIIDTCLRYNVVLCTYDEYQLHYLMTELSNMGICWVRKFSQGAPREVADKQLYDYIKTRKLGYNPNDSLIDHASIREHLQNSGRHQKPNEDTKLRIVKMSEGGKIDLTVCMSMNVAEVMRLDL